MQAVIQSGSHQYLVEKGQTLQVELLVAKTPKVEFSPLLIIDKDTVLVGTPHVEGAKVTAQIQVEPVKGEKIKVLHYKAKKRQSVQTGHRQRYSAITITDIKAKSYLLQLEKVFCCYTWLSAAKGNFWYSIWAIIWVSPVSKSDLT